MGLEIISLIYLYPNISLKYHLCFIDMNYLLHGVCVCVCVCAFEVVDF